MLAEKICENGFAALSSLDAGYYGKGSSLKGREKRKTPTRGKKEGKHEK